MTRKTLIVSWIARVIVIAIFARASVPKFTGDPVSVSIFETLGVEPWGRLLTGALEAGAAVMLLIPRTVAPGAALAIVIMIGAVAAHIFRLGYEGDMGVVFPLALVVLAAAAIVAGIHRKDLPIIGG